MRRLSLLLLLPLAACHPAGDPHAQAKALIAANCIACHQVPGVRGAEGLVGPSLKGIARQQILAGHFVNSPDNMQRWLLHPQAMLPGNAMPEMRLTPAQARAISDYLYTLDKR